jgi:predicted secreted protein
MAFKEIFMRIVSVLLASAVLAFSVPALADDIRPGPGQTLVNVSATERTTVTQDLLIATLRAEKESADAASVQADINTLMKKASDKAKTVKGVQVSTDGYYVYQNDPNPSPMPADKSAERRPVTWRGGQSITLQGKDSESILKLAGDLQAMGLIMNGLSYTLSPDKTETVKDGLMEGALAKVKARAERAAAALGKSKTELVEISVDSAMPDYPRPMMMAMKAMDGAAESMPAPTAEPGQADITLTVTARALLSP